MLTAKSARYKDQSATEQLCQFQPQLRPAQHGQQKQRQQELDFLSHQEENKQTEQEDIYQHRLIYRIRPHLRPPQQIIGASLYQDLHLHLYQDLHLHLGGDKRRPFHLLMVCMARACREIPEVFLLAPKAFHLSKVGIKIPMSFKHGHRARVRRVRSSEVDESRRYRA